MRSLRSMLVPTAALAIGIGACNLGGDPVDDGAEAAVRTIFALDRAPGPAALIVSRLELMVAEVAFESESPPVSLEVDQRAAVDVFAGTSDLAPIRLAPTSYTEVQIEAELWEAGPAPALRLEGTLGGVPIVLVHADTTSFALARGALTLPSGGSIDAVFTLRPGAWFADVAPGELERSADDVAYIDEARNEDVYDRVVDRIADVEADWAWDDVDEPSDDTGDTGDTGDTF